MKHMRDLIKSFDERTVALRKEITEAIIDLLTKNDLTELRLCREPDHQVFVAWFDDNSNGYDSQVIAVKLIDNGFEIEVYCDESSESTHSISAQYGDFACNNIDWLVAILDNMVFTLSLPESKGVATIAGRTISWSYTERGLGELPEREVEEIAEMLKEGKTNGSLYHNDNDVEYEGEWYIDEEPSAKEKIETLRTKDKQLGLSMEEVIRSIIAENDGRITYLLPEEADEDDCPVSLNLQGDIWNYNFYITSIYLGEEGQIMADGFEMLDGVRHDSSQVVDSEHYPQILDFITETLNL